MQKYLGLKLEIINCEIDSVEGGITQMMQYLTSWCCKLNIKNCLKIHYLNFKLQMWFNIYNHFFNYLSLMNNFCRSIKKNYFLAYIFLANKIKFIKSQQNHVCRTRYNDLGEYTREKNLSLHVRDKCDILRNFRLVLILFESFKRM